MSSKRLIENEEGVDSLSDEMREALGLNEELDLDDIDVVDSEEDEIEIETKESEEPEPEVEQKSQETEEPVAQKRKDTSEQRKSRAQERIRELVDEKKKIKAERDLEREAKAAIEAENRRLQIELAEAQVGKYDAAIEVARREYIDAEDSGDATAKLAAHEKVAKLTTGKMALEQAIKSIKNNAPQTQTQDETEAAPRKPAAPQKVEINEAAKEWLDRNAWFPKDQASLAKLNRADRLRTQLAVEITEQLNAEGTFSEDSDEFYDEVDNRLSEALAELGIGSVQSSQEGSPRSSPSGQTEDVKQNDQPQTQSKASSPQQQPKSPVGGGSPGMGSQSNQKRRVTLTPREKSLADELGVSHQDYARNKLRLQMQGEA